MYVVTFQQGLYEFLKENIFFKTKNVKYDKYNQWMNDAFIS